MKKILCTVLLFFLPALAGCSIGENPDTQEFDIQYKEPNMEEGIDEMFENK